MNETITWGMIAASAEPIKQAPFNWAVFASIVVPIAVAGLGALGLWVSHRTQKGSRENILIDQLQEQLDRADDRSDKQDARMGQIEARLQAVERISRGRLEYIYVLRRHISNGEPPPAPEWPPGIND